MKKAERLKQKRERAQEVEQHWASLTTAQKIADLDRRLGKGKGAKKQRARLAAQLEAEKTEKKTKKEQKS
jgi:hypothetical protein